MFRLNKIFISVPLALAFCAGSAGAGFQDYGMGARGAGKAGAFIASVDDASAMLWNPAGLNEVFMKEAMLSYHKPYAGLEGIDLSMGFLSFAYPVDGVANFGFAATSYNGDGKYKETTVQVTAAKDLSMTFSLPAGMILAGGLNLRYLNSTYLWDDEIKALDDPITATDGAGALTADIGLIFQPVYGLPVGLTVKNLLPADVGLVGEDKVPMEIKLGAASRMGFVGAFDGVVPEVVIGYRNHDYDDGKLSFGAGVEGWLAERTIGLRCGVNNNEAALGASFERFIGSYMFRIDYAAVLSFTLGDNAGSHRFSTSLRF